MTFPPGRAILVFTFYLLTPTEVQTKNHKSYCLCQPVRIFIYLLNIIFYAFLPTLLVFPLLPFGTNYRPLSGNPTHWTPLTSD